MVGPVYESHSLGTRLLEIPYHGMTHLIGKLDGVALFVSMDMETSVGSRVPLSVRDNNLGVLK